jgi:hypothetical protein
MSNSNPQLPLSSSASSHQEMVVLKHTILKWNIRFIFKSCVKQFDGSHQEYMQMESGYER